jgi:hypothetical protein
MHMIQSVKQPTEETSFFLHLDRDSNIEIAATVTGLGPLICNDVNFDSSIRMMRRDVELTSMHRQVGMANLEFQRTYHLCTTSVLILSSEALEDPSEALPHFVSLDSTANFTGTTGEPKVHTTLTSLHDLMHIDKFQGAATFSVSLSTLPCNSCDSIEQPQSCLRTRGTLKDSVRSVASSLCSSRPTAMSVLERGWLFPYCRATRPQNELLITMMFPLEIAIGVGV